MEAITINQFALVCIPLHLSAGSCFLIQCLPSGRGGHDSPASQQSCRPKATCSSSSPSPKDNERNSVLRSKPLAVATTVARQLRDRFRLFCGLLQVSRAVCKSPRQRQALQEVEFSAWFTPRYENCT